MEGHCKDLNMNLCDQGYIIVMTKIDDRIPPSNYCKCTYNLPNYDFFDSDTQSPNRGNKIDKSPNEVPLFTIEELQLAASTLKTKQLTYKQR